MKTITIVEEMHAALYKRYDLASSGFVTVGDRAGRYAPEDSKTGAEYRCLACGKRGKKVLHSSDYKPGLFYPVNVFVYGYDNEKDAPPVMHEEIEDFCKKIGYGGFTRRVILPNGWNKGKMTWDNGIMFSPVEMKPNLQWLSKTLKEKFPDADIDSTLYTHCILVHFDA